jgi:hypothetical protein
VETSKAYEQNGGYNLIYNNWLKASLPDPLRNKFTLDVVQGLYPNESLYDCLMIRYRLFTSGIS